MSLTSFPSHRQIVPGRNVPPTSTLRQATPRLPIRETLSTYTKVSLHSLLIRNELSTPQPFPIVCPLYRVEDRVGFEACVGKGVGVVDDVGSLDIPSPEISI